MHLLTLAALASTAMAFADTAAFYSSRGLESAHLQYITKAADLDAAFGSLTAAFCASAADNDRLWVYRVSQLQRAAPENAGADATFLQHVRYADAAQLDLSIADSCSVSYVSGADVDSASITGNVVVVDVDEAKEHAIADFLGRHANVVVQGKPAFHTAGSRGEHIKDFLGDYVDLDRLHADKLENGLDKLRGDLGKRADDLEGEIEADFRAAEAMIAAEDDASVTALDADATVTGLAEHAAKNGTAKSNLFTNYQFFTPGVWSALIVSFFLLYVATTAVSWITSIELSYKSFEKQIEYEKKTE